MAEEIVITDPYNEGADDERLLAIEERLLVDTEEGDDLLDVTYGILPGDDYQQLYEDRNVLYWSSVLAKIVVVFLGRFKQTAGFAEELSWTPHSPTSLIAAVELFVQTVDGVLWPCWMWVDDMEQVVNVLTNIPVRPVGFEYWNATINDYYGAMKTLIALCDVPNSDEANEWLARQRLSEPVSLFSLSSLLIESATAKGDEPIVDNASFTWSEFVLALEAMTNDTGSFFTDASEETYDGYSDFVPWEADQVDHLRRTWIESSKWYFALNTFTELCRTNEQFNYVIHEFLVEMTAVYYERDLENLIKADWLRQIGTPIAGSNGRAFSLSLADLMKHGSLINDSMPFPVPAKAEVVQGVS